MDTEWWKTVVKEIEKKKRVKNINLKMSEKQIKSGRKGVQKKSKKVVEKEVKKVVQKR